MRLKPDTRIALVRAGCVAVAAYVSWPLFDMTPPRNPPELLTPAVQRVRVHAPRPQPAPAKTRETIIIRSEKAPTEKLVLKEQKAVEAPPEPTKPVPPVEVPPPDTPPMLPVEQMFIPQPGLPANSARPPAPPDDLPVPLHFNDKPGGSVVILGVKLDSNNIAVMTDILVASDTPLNDLALAMTTRGVRWKDVDPPIPPGEYRWVELRLDYASGNDNTILP
jgi:hypothetical protein